MPPLERTRPTIPQGADDFARTLGSHLPTRLAQTRRIAQGIRAFGRSKGKRTGRRG